MAVAEGRPLAQIGNIKNGRATAVYNNFTCIVCPEGSVLHLGSFMSSQAIIVGSSLYVTPVMLFFLVSIACLDHPILKVS